MAAAAKRLPLPPARILSLPPRCRRVVPFLPLMTVSSVSYGLDESLFRAINLAGTNAVLDLLMAFFSAIALPYILPFLSLPLWWKGRRELAFDLLVLLVVVVVVTEALKYAIGRPRPCDALPGVNLLTPGACAAEADPAFPSGHASRIFAVAALLSLTFKWSVRLGSFAVAILTGVSRIYLGVHWPSDVLGGAVLGVALAFVFVWLARRLRFYQKLRTRVVETVARSVQRGTKA